MSTTPTTSNVSQGQLTTQQASKFWLVKLPAFVAQQWLKEKEPKKWLGSLDVVNTPSGEQMTLRLHPNEQEMSQYTISSSSPAFQGPKECKFIKRAQHAAMVVFSDRIVSDDGKAPKTEEKTKQIEYKSKLEGAIGITADVKVSMGEEYKNVLRTRLNQSLQKPRNVKRLPADASSIKQTSTTSYYDHFEKQKKRKVEEQDRIKKPEKRVRLDKNVLEEFLFKLFDKQRYYTIQQLLELTQQPKIFLREVLDKLCYYHKSGEHIHTFSLKESYTTHQDNVDDVAATSNSEQNDESANAD